MHQHRPYTLLERILFPYKGFDRKRLDNMVKGKTILITGASEGIGECLAYTLARSGALLILTARNEAKLQQVKLQVEQEGGQASIFAADLNQPAQVADLSKFLTALPKGVDIVISNAGKSIRRSTRDSQDRLHDFTRTAGINYLGPVQLLLSLLPVLEQNKGHVINVSAINVLLAPAPMWAAYQASKTAFDQWIRTALPELKGYGISVSSVYLPLVRTGMIEPTATYRDMPAMSRQHAADVICRMIISRRNNHRPWWLIFGQVGSLLFRRVWEQAATRYMSKRKAEHDQ